MHEFLFSTYGTGQSKPERVFCANYPCSGRPKEIESAQQTSGQYSTPQMRSIAKGCQTNKEQKRDSSITSCGGSKSKYRSKMNPINQRISRSWQQNISEQSGCKIAS